MRKYRFYGGVSRPVRGYTAEGIIDVPDGFPWFEFSLKITDEDGTEIWIEHFDWELVEGDDNK